MKYVENQIFYHVQRGRQNVSHVGDILKSGINENDFLGFYRTFDLNNVAPQTALAELRRYLREQIFENVRKTQFPDLPSRFYCLWIIPDSPILNESLTFWIPRVVGNINDTFRVLKLSCTGHVHYACEEYLALEKCNTLQATCDNAVHYWRGDNVIIGSPQVEALFYGDALVQEVVNPFDPKHQL